MADEHEHEQDPEPDQTAVRVALWRALHAEADAEPHVLEDLVGARLADPGPGWRERPDMNPEFTGARASGTPFISFFAPEEMLGLAREAGFSDVRHVPSAELNARYFAGRSDGLRVSTGEDLLVATT
jgi:O-methyltransferase involved in polyketide biosynthesis